METFREFFIAELPSVEGDALSEDEIIMLYHSPGITVRDISTQSGKSIGEIYRLLRRRNCAPNRASDRHGSVVDLSEAGFSIQTIADLTGYTARNVRYILSKKSES